MFNEVHDYLFCLASLDIKYFFLTSDFNLCELKMGGPIWPTVVSPHWCWTGSYCIFSNLQQKCASMIKNRISCLKWFFRTEEVGRGFFKDIFQIQWPSACISLPPFWPAQMLWIPFHHLIQQKSQLLALGMFLFPLTCGVARNKITCTWQYQVSSLKKKKLKIYICIQQHTLSSHFKQSQTTWL